MEGITELQELREDLSERTAINFSRTSAVDCLHTKVRLEVYAIPMRWNEQLVCFTGRRGGRAIPTRYRICSVAHARLCVGGSKLPSVV